MNWKTMVTITLVSISIMGTVSYSVFENQRKQRVAFENGYSKQSQQVYNYGWVKMEEGDMQVANTIAKLSEYVNKDAQMTQRILGELNAINKALENKRDKR